jgi:flavorubredoxin
MSGCLKAEQISANVWHVGVTDWNVRNFHGYLTQRGTTYNAFLIIDKKITLIDTVKAEFAGELLERISSVIDPKQIDYIISNHSEPDHSGALPEIIRAVEPEKVFASSFGANTLKNYYGIEVEAVADKSAIELGEGTLTFVETKMLHWPDSMVSYYDRDEILFAQDAFGMHLAGSKIWADEYPADILEYEMRKYFANILNLQSAKILALLDTLPSLGLKISVLAPDHGPIYRQGFDKVYALYREFATQQTPCKAVVVYCTMWHSTEALARAFADGVKSAGVDVKLIDLANSDRSEVMTEVASSGLLAFGSPAMNNQMFPAMADALTYIRGLKPLNKIGYVFGSCGWSNLGVKQVVDEVAKMNIEQPVEFMCVKYRPNDAELEQSFNNGVTLAGMLKEKCGQN